MQNDRVIPQEKFVAGGLYSLRGYPQSIVSGDSGITGTVEYRLHLPRLLPINRQQETRLFGDTFRMVPEQVYGFPDWDFIVKVFSDAGYIVNQDRIDTLETNESLWSVGTGVEVQLRRNLRMQVDYGYALLGLDSGEADRGNHEIHFEVSLFY
jgi:hemolysin activation/secretion protein